MNTDVNWSHKFPLQVFVESGPLLLVHNFIKRSQNAIYFVECTDLENSSPLPH